MICHHLAYLLLFTSRPPQIEWSFMFFARGCVDRGPTIWSQLQECGWW